MIGAAILTGLGILLICSLAGWVMVEAIEQVMDAH